MLDVLLAPPVRMEFRGLPERTFQTGVTITVDAVPSKTKSNEVRAQTVTINGKNDRNALTISQEPDAEVNVNVLDIT